MTPITIDTTAIPAPVYRDLAGAARKFFESAENRAEFERWREGRRNAPAYIEKLERRAKHHETR